MTDMRGAVRSGLYAMRSTIKPSATVSTTTSGIDVLSGSAEAQYTMKKPAAVKMSPCAKLIRRRMPYTIV